MIDREELLNRCLGNLSLAQRILDRFSHEFERNLGQMRQLAESGDGVEFRRLTHQLKGTSANIAAPRLYARLVRLNETEVESLDAQLEEELSQLAEEFSRFRVACDDFAAEDGIPS